MCHDWASGSRSVAALEQQLQEKVILGQEAPESPIFVNTVPYVHAAVRFRQEGVSSEHVVWACPL